MCAPEYAPLDDVLFLTTTTAKEARTAFGVYFYFFVQILIFCVLTGKALKQQMGRKFSMKTTKLLKKFRETLMVQVSIPVCILFIPLSYLGISNWSGFHFQFLNNISFIMISSHGFFSTIVMLIVHRPYREFTMNLTRFGVIYSNEVNTHIIFEMRTYVIT
ncbi:hypothetical protein CAEBREN_12179 [Caenorhabditis brenneri]|uniref:Serpentine Receptor, class H n=1 Tax=Caenorhabditis brenneri TaxID=135651 RepID=G0NHX8_CAEBE|nr:hypothetical protein CAEBREN_12179 [Caenorhabditis brenneri]